tara:strand:- start:167 stop:697 length:531 start_codon:yes stop_codon:yes gene_type:complete
MWKGIEENTKLDKQLKKKGKNFVMTNPDMAKYLIENHTNILHGDIVMEPCKGSGSFYDNLPEYSTNHYCEIEEGLDYLKDMTKVDITLSNPPFVPRKLFWDFHTTAMKNTRREIYWLINMSSLNVFTPKRLEEMRELGWYINNFQIVSDKRWFGRYVWVKISKENTNTFGWNRKVF